MEKVVGFWRSGRKRAAGPSSLLSLSSSFLVGRGVDEEGNTRLRPGDELGSLESRGLQKSITSWWEWVGELGEEVGGEMVSICGNSVGPWFSGSACECEFVAGLICCRFWTVRYALECRL